MPTVLVFPTPQDRAAAALAAFGATVRARREALGWSQQDVAATCGCSQSTVARIEAGGDPQLSTAVAMTHALGIALRPFLDADPSSAATPIESARARRRSA